MADRGKEATIKRIVPRSQLVYLAAHRAHLCFHDELTVAPPALISYTYYFKSDGAEIQLEMSESFSLVNTAVQYLTTRVYFLLGTPMPAVIFKSDGAKCLVNI